jgi:methyltransferase
VVLGSLTGAQAPAEAALAAIVLERLFELALSRRRVRRLSGDRPGGELEWLALVLVHAALLLLPPLEARFLGARAPDPWMWASIAALLLAQALRYWCVLALGPAWNARAVVDPALGFVERGPYRWVRHPNYLAVLLEFSALPLLFGAWRSWILLNLLHLPLIARRIAGEERLLRRIPGYSARMEHKGRFLPRRSRGRV